MGRRSPTNSFLTPIKSDGTLPVPATDFGVPGDKQRGVFTLTALTTYYVPLPAEDAWLLSLLSQWDAAMIITSITIEETDLPEDLATWYSASTGLWFATDAAKITSAFNGAGTTTNTNDVIAHTVAGAGAAIQNIQDTAVRRHRAVVVVGATGGEARFTGWAKE